MAERKELHSLGPAPAARILHTCRSRTRLGIPDLKGDKDRLSRLCDAVLDLGPVQRVEARVLTGSLVVHHEGDAEKLREDLERAHLLKVLREPEQFDPISEAQAWSRHVNSLLQEFGGRGVSVWNLAALALFAVALRQLAAGNVLPPAATALWYALTLLSGDGRAEGPHEDKRPPPRRD